MEFPNLEDTYPRLLVALILSYKRSTQVKERRSRQPKRKTEKKQQEKRIQERN